MDWRIAAWMGVLACGLAGCARPPAGPSCPMPGERAMLGVTLYFGAGVPGRAPVSDTEWAEFARREITPRFPDGFTVLSGRGQWMNPATHEIGGEQTRTVRIDVVDTPGLAARVAAVQSAYRLAFRQMAVGVETGAVCAAF